VRPLKNVYLFKKKTIYSLAKNFKKGESMKKILLSLLILGVTSVMADGKALFGKCAGCHGASGEKAALGKSNIIKGQSASALESHLKGYKDGSYGGAMKGLMKGQVGSMSDADIKAVAEYMATFK